MSKTETTVVILVVIVYLIGLYVGNMAPLKTIVTDSPIEPEIKLIIKDNKVDTLYIYQK